MLNQAQRTFLIKNVDRHALSEERIRAMAEYRIRYPIADDEIKVIADLVCLQESTIRALAAF